MQDNQNKSQENKGASPVSNIANGNLEDKDVLNDEQTKSVSGKEAQHQPADNASQNNDDEDSFDLDSLKGNVHNDRKGEASDVDSSK